MTTLLPPQERAALVLREVFEDILRVDTADEGITRLRWYYFCPETLTEIATRLGLPCRGHGYRL